MNWRLRRQLRKSGASKAEAAKLANVASALGDLEVSGLGKPTKNAIAENIGIKQPRVRLQPKFALSGAFVFFVVLTLLAQSAQPGSLLHALRRGSEAVRIKVQPSSEDEIIRRRQQEQEDRDGNNQHSDHRSLDSTSGGHENATDGGSGSDDQYEPADSSSHGSDSSEEPRETFDDKAETDSGDEANESHDLEDVEQQDDPED